MPDKVYHNNTSINMPNEDFSEDKLEIEENFEHEDLEIKENFVGKLILKIRGKIYELIKKPIFKWIILGIIVLLYPVYFGFAMKNTKPFNIPKNLNSSTVINDYIFNNNPGLALFILTIVVILFILWENVIKRFGRKLNLGKKVNFHPKYQKIFSRFGPWILIGIVSALCIAYLIYDLKDVYNLVSLGGLLTFLFICILMSEHPSMVNWRALVVGILIQYILGVFILRLEFGYRMFQFLGHQVSTFLDYTDNGSRLVFGNTFTDHYFAFKVMPVVIFFSAMVNILYYFGAVQYILLKIAWLMNLLMGTSPTESVNSVANIFVGPSEAPLLIKPFLPKMTESELFAVMVAAFSTVSGSVLAAYIGFGVPPDHLITAGLMSAPASLAIAKTLFPETKKTHAHWEAIRNVKTKKLNNVFEAISSGAIEMLKPVGAILANLIAFVSIFAFLDSICIWFFGMVGLENFGLASILQYLFWPFAFLMGADSEDCKSIAKLVGTKVFVNEFVAYTKLGAVKTFRDAIIANGTEPLYRNGTLAVPSGLPMIWNDRSIVIATYALCGFANFGTIGIEIATLSVFAPTRTKTFIKYAGKAMIAGNFSSFMNACIAGLLFKKIK